MVRRGEVRDIFRIVRMSQKFWAQTEYSDIEHDDEHVADVALNCMNAGLMAVLDDDEHGVVGFVCGVQHPVLANPNVTFVAEIAWWVNEDHRGHGNGRALLEFIENLARERGASRMTMMVMEHPDPAPGIRLYEHCGYHSVEHSYSKRLR